MLRTTRPPLCYYAPVLLRLNRTDMQNQQRGYDNIHESFRTVDIAPIILLTSNPPFHSIQSFPIQHPPTALPNLTQRLPPNPPLHTLPRLQNAPISRNIHTLARPRQTRNIPRPSPPRNDSQILTTNPYPPRRLTNQFHILQHGFIIPVFET